MKNIIINNVLSLPPHVDMFYHRDEIPDPNSMGFKESIGEPVGQLSDHRFPLGDGRSIHLKIFDKWTGVHWDKVHPNTIENCFEHLRRDSPLWYTSMCTIAGWGIGAGLSTLSGNRKAIAKSSLAGGAIGFIFGILTAEWD